jgi:hypothetical protein
MKHGSTRVLPVVLATLLGLLTIGCLGFALFLQPSHTSQGPTQSVPANR